MWNYDFNDQASDYDIEEAILLPTERFWVTDVCPLRETLIIVLKYVDIDRLFSPYAVVRAQGCSLKSVVSGEQGCVGYEVA